MVGEWGKTHKQPKTKTKNAESPKQQKQQKSQKFKWFKKPARQGGLHQIEPLIEPGSQKRGYERWRRRSYFVKTNTCRALKNATKSAQKLNTRHAEIWPGDFDWFECSTTAPLHHRMLGQVGLDLRNAATHARAETPLRPHLSPPSNSCTFRSANWPAKRRTGPIAAATKRGDNFVSLFIRISGSPVLSLSINLNLFRGV